MLDQIKKYEFYKRQFKVKNTPYFEPFERLIQNAPKYWLECSHKIEGSKVFSTRYGLFFRNVSAEAFNKIFNFYSEVSALDNIDINYGIIKNIYNDLNFDKIKKPGCGIDYRSKIKDSRVKFWLQMSDYSQKVHQILKIHGSSAEIRSMLKNSP